MTIIATQADLLKIKDGGNYFLTNDIQLTPDFADSSISLSNSVFNGGGKTISGLKINKSASTGTIGLFSSIDNSIVRNLTVQDAAVNFNCSQGCDVGILAGNMSRGRICNVTVNGSITSAQSGTSNFVGGVIGRAGLYDFNGNIPLANLKESMFFSVLANVSVSNFSGGTGGLVGSQGGGMNSLGTMVRTQSNGSVSGCDFSGGLAGGVRGLVWGSSASGSVTASSGSISKICNFGGGLIGGASRGSIVGSSASGAISGKWNQAGGLAGAIGNRETVIGASASGSVAALIVAGGLAGSVGDTWVIASHASGDVKSVPVAGGLIGDSGNSFVSQSYATGKVIGTPDATINTSLKGVGGLIGQNVLNTAVLSWFSNAGLVIDSYATGSVAIANDTLLSGRISGGLVGENIGGTINSCFSSAVVTPVNSAFGQIAGGLVGKSTGGAVNASYWDTQVSGATASLGGGEGLTTVQMKNQSSFNNWNFVDVWKINGGYPFLLQNP